MALISATPRPDILLTIIQDKPDLKAFIAWAILAPYVVGVSSAPIPRVLRRARIERLKRSRYGKYTRATLEVVDNGTYSCKDEGNEEAYDAKDVEIFKGEDNCQRVMGSAALRTNLLAQESAVATTLMSTSTFGSGFNGAAIAAWDQAGGKPLDDIALGKQTVLLACGMEPNTLVIGAGLYTKLKRNAQIQSQVRAVMGYTDKKGIVFDVSPADLAMVFGLEQVLVGRAAYDSADEGQTATMGFVWPSDKALLAYLPDAADEFAPHLGRTFIWDDGLMDFGDAQQLERPFEGVVLEHYYETANNTGIMRARRNLDTMILNKDSGYLITGC